MIRLLKSTGIGLVIAGILTGALALLLGFIQLLINLLGEPLGGLAAIFILFAVMISLLVYLSKEY